MKLSHRWALSALFFSALSGSAKAQTQFERIVDPLVNAAMSANQVPGLSIAIARRGTPLLVKGYGVTDLWNPKAVDARTVFQLASVSKQFTAAVAMRVHEQRALFGLNFVEDPVKNWLYGSTWFDNPSAAFPADVRVKHLLQMTGGLAEVSAYWNAKNALSQIVTGPRAFSPAGGQFLYSNGGYFALAKVVEAATGRPFSTALRDYIVTPLGLNDTTTDWPPGTRPFATGHARGFMNIPVPGIPNYPREGMAGWGSVNSTAADVARWDAALMDGTAVSRATFERMMTPPGSFSDYGMGLSMFFYGAPMNQTAVRHAGRFLGYGFFTYNIMFPQSGFIAVVLTNQDWYAPDALAHDVVNAICRDPALAANCR